MVASKLVIKSLNSSKNKIITILTLEAEFIVTNIKIKQL